MAKQSDTIDVIKASANVKKNLTVKDIPEWTIDIAKGTQLGLHLVSELKPKTPKTS